MKITAKGKVARFIRMAEGDPINGYSVDGATGKRYFLNTGALILADLASLIGPILGQYEIRKNPAGPAVSGDVILHADHLYVCFSQDSNAEWGFYWRTCDSRTDYEGHKNRWMPWSALENRGQVAEEMRKTIDDVIPDIERRKDGQ